MRQSIMKTKEIKADEILKEHEDDLKQKGANGDLAERMVHTKILSASNSMNFLPPKVHWKKYSLVPSPPQDEHLIYEGLLKVPILKLDQNINQYSTVSLRKKNSGKTISSPKIEGSHNLRSEDDIVV